MMKILNKFPKTHEKQALSFHDNDAIKMEKIVKTFKIEAGEFTALKGIDITFHKGEFVGVSGRSGSGKSTLINMITGIDHPTSGEVIIGDTKINLLNESRMAKWRGRNLGIVFQFYQLLPMLSLLENIMLPMDFADLFSPAERENRAMDLLKMVGLGNLADKMPSAVSGGQQQAAAIARALATDPPIITADEPTGNLDTRTADMIFEIFQSLVEKGKTIIMVTHDSALAERTTRQVVISDGEIINEWIIRTLPMLSHSQMLRATKCLVPTTYDPGSPIIREGVPNDVFFIITRGEVEILVDSAGGKRHSVQRLGAGDHFG